MSRGQYKLRPQFARVLLKRERLAKVGQIIIPEDSQKRLAGTLCTVVEMGPNCELKLRPGTEVLIGQYAGAWMNADGQVGQFSDSDLEEFYICQEDDILAVREKA